MVSDQVDSLLYQRSGVMLDEVIELRFTQVGHDCPVTSHQWTTFLLPLLHLGRFLTVDVQQLFELVNFGDELVTSSLRGHSLG